MQREVRLGDCLEVMPALAADSVDAIVCDPPYGLSFMGRDWDHGIPGMAFWAAALRVAKPGAHLVAFGGTRTFHRLACAIEDAGWEIRDTLMWLYGSGFPKSLDVSKALDKAAGAERVKVPATGNLHHNANLNDDGWSKIGSGEATMDGPVPITDLAKRYAGWGTALKPAWEPIILARKPLSGTVAATVSQFGTGGLNIGATRIGTGDDRASGGVDYSMGYHGGGAGREARPTGGRWPANVLLDPEAAALLDAQSGERKAGVAVRHRSGGNTFGGDNAKPPLDDMGYGDTGGASRFFYTAKASRREREAGLEGMPQQVKARSNGAQAALDRGEDTEHDSFNSLVKARNVHPTVKPLALMRWLCRLVTPPGGLILDPFTGSGSTGCAAVLEGFRFLGIEQSEEYCRIAERRIAHWTPVQPDLEPAA